jgi:Flp pilus assembly pilin Flp
VATRKPLVTGHRSLVTVTGQSAIEYAVLIAVVVAALVGMSVYTKRALMGKWRTVGDSFGYGRQYEPRVTQVSQ